MTIAAPVLASARDLVQARLRTVLSRLDPQLAAIAGYHFGWLDAQGRPLAGDGGKMLRASLVLLSAAACGADPSRGLPGATAVELVHNFSLLHDDVMDGDERRRHRPTAWTVFGVSAAIVAGDALLALALDELCDNPPAARHLAIAVQRLCSGQLADLGLERRTNATVAECMTMAAGKPGLCSPARVRSARSSPKRPPRSLPRWSDSASTWAWRSRWPTTSSVSGAIRRSPASR